LTISALDVWSSSKEAKMKRKILLISLILMFSLSGLGCETLNKALREKFIRKKKGEEEKTKQLIRVEEEEVYPNKIRYKMHYVYWDAWMTELINYLGRSYKKDVANCRRALENLEKMGEFLKEEKTLFLQPYIEELTEAKEDLVQRKITSEIDKKILKRHLKKLWMAVRREFAPYKLDEKWIKPDY
jgi:hypothetical protein